MKTLLKNAREAKGLRTRELAAVAKIDQALISKFETGARTPTHQQLLRLAAILEIDRETIEILWLKEKILKEVDGNPLAIQALKAAENEIAGTEQPQAEIGAASIQKLMDEMELLKSILSGPKKL